MIKVNLQKKSARSLFSPAVYLKDICVKHILCFEKSDKYGDNNALFSFML